MQDYHLFRVDYHRCRCHRCRRRHRCHRRRHHHRHRPQYDSFSFGGCHLCNNPRHPLCGAVAAVAAVDNLNLYLYLSTNLFSNCFVCLLQKFYDTFVSKLRRRGADVRVFFWRHRVPFWRERRSWKSSLATPTSTHQSKQRSSIHSFLTLPMTTSIASIHWLI